MTLFYSVIFAFAALMSALRIRQWMFEQVPPGATFYFFRRPVLKLPAGGFVHQRNKVEDLEAFDDDQDTEKAATTANGFLKRAIDIALSLGLLIVLAPLALLTAFAIKLDSPGPVLYRQKRVGQCGRIFEVLKFRSMRVDAEKDGPQWASVEDNRITAVGRIIRKLRIDEIPQTINVLKGEMSFVGPRPERPEFVTVLEEQIPHYQSRHLVKPGITGWAQVKHQYTASIDGAREKLKYDLYYVKEISPRLDLFIILLTFRVVLFGIGAR